jgi:hypothetical protein
MAGLDLDTVTVESCRQLMRDAGYMVSGIDSYVSTLERARAYMVGDFFGVMLSSIIITGAYAEAICDGEIDDLSRLMEASFWFGGRGYRVTSIRSIVTEKPYTDTPGSAVVLAFTGDL